MLVAQLPVLVVKFAELVAQLCSAGGSVGSADG